ncbi:MAG TPA: gluconokinase [Devosiaceae bacterium]|jgi:carbohydrate kinase (thermoresistant glucokinase family)
MSTAPLPPRFDGYRIVVVMGVSSSGKSTVGQAIGRKLHAPFLDGDGYHPPANVEKMRAGIPLTDEDRWPWLASLATGLHDATGHKGIAIGACSALKRSYREYLAKKAGEPILFVFLSGDKAVIAERMARRHHEYMPTSLLDSQFATLELPAADEPALTVPVTDAVDKIAETVAKALPHLKSFKRKQ